MAKKNKKLGRRSLAVLLTLIMVFSLFQITALAADMNCGKVEHSHSDDCYAVIEHEHGDESSECYSDHEHNARCKREDHIHSTETCAYVEHVHGDACYSAHRHSDDCKALDCDRNHRHRDSCYVNICGKDRNDLDLSCGYEENEPEYSCEIRYEYPECPAKDFSCELNVGENTVTVCGLEEHSHSKACYPESTYMFDHIDLRIESGGYTLTLGGVDYDLTLAFSGNAADTFSITVPGGSHRDDGKTFTLVPELQYDEGAHVAEFGLKRLEISGYHEPHEFSISGTVLVLKSQIDALPEVLRAEFEALPTAEYTADQVHSGNDNDGGVYYRLPLINYHPTGNTCTGTPTGILNHSRKGYDFDLHPSAVLTPITDFVVVNKIVVDENGNPISDEQSFEFSLGNISGDLGKSISLRGGESGSFSGLASGLYTVTETPTEGYKPVAYNGQSWSDALYVQEVQSVSKVDGTAGSVTFYNMKLVDKGALKVGKTVTGTAAAAYTGRYSFEIKDASGETVTSLVLANGQSQEIILPAGSYTVTETGAVANGSDILTVSANGSVLELGDEGYTANVTIGKAESVNVVFNNNYDAYLAPPVEPETEEWTVIHNYYLDGTEFEGSSSYTVEVEAGQQPEAEREWYYKDNYYTALGLSIIDDEIRTVTMNYTREYYAPSTPTLYPVSYEYIGTVPANAPVVPETAEYEEGMEVIVAENPTLEGYTFSGWDKENFIMPGEPVVIRGSWTVIEQPPVEPPYIPPYIPPVEPPVIDIPDEEPPLVELPEEEPPLVELPEEEPPLAELPDEDVPLADVPKTGDSIAAYVILALLSAFGLAALSFSGKKLRRSK